MDSTLAPPPTRRQPFFVSSSSSSSSSPHAAVDIVIHSATKYLGGHSDALGGLILASPYTEMGRRLYPLLRRIQTSTGGTMSAMDAWLILRGLRTLHLRVQRQSTTALILAQWLQHHPRIVVVHYPGLPPQAIEPSSHDMSSHENQQQQQQQQQYAIAQKQMNVNLYGGVLSIELATEVMAMAFVGGLEIIQRATSLGGTETLIEHRASIEPIQHRSSPAGLLRISVGLEDPHDLINDMQNALRIMDRVCSPAGED
jgi:cystathionine gamma-synthase